MNIIDELTHLVDNYRFEYLNTKHDLQTLTGLMDALKSIITEMDYTIQNYRDDESY